jgi:hypothetical protein
VKRQHDDGRRIGSVFRGCVVTTLGGRHSKDLPGVRGRLQRVQTIRFRPVEQCDRAEQPCSERFEFGASLAPGCKIAERHGVGGGAFLNGHDAVAVGVRQRPNQGVVDEAENRGVRPDSDGEQQNDDDRKGRRTQKRARSLNEIPPYVIDRHEFAGRLIELARGFDAAECTTGSKTRRLGRQPLPDVVVLQQRQMCGDLTLGIGAAVVRPDRMPQPKEEMSNPGDHDGVSPSSRVFTNVERRRQRSACAERPRSPARVIA